MGGGGGVVHQAKQTVGEILKTFLGWGGILSPQLILLRGPMISRFGIVMFVLVILNKGFKRK